MAPMKLFKQQEQFPSGEKGGKKLSKYPEIPFNHRSKSIYFDYLHLKEI